MDEIYLTLTRLGPDSDGNERGILKVENSSMILASFTSRENDENLKYSSLRVGTYEMKHSMKTHNLDGTPSAYPKKCLRPTDDRIKSVLIHAASSDDPDNLSGCIAPGSWRSLFSFTDSATAMAELLEAIGGYQEGNLVNLKVLTNATGVGDSETKETWKRTK